MCGWGLGPVCYMALKPQTSSWEWYQAVSDKGVSRSVNVVSGEHVVTNPIQPAARVREGALGLARPWDVDVLKRTHPHVYRAYLFRAVCLCLCTPCCCMMIPIVVCSSSCPGGYLLRVAPRLGTMFLWTLYRT